MLTKKRCPRCGGNIYLEEDSFGCWGYCLQCGHECDLENAAKAPEKLTLSGMGKPPTQNVSKLGRLKVELKQD